MDRSELTSRLTIEEAEAQNLVEHKFIGRKPIPFGFMNAEWRQLKANFQEGDELWTFCSSPWTWENLGGRAGIAIVREGEVVFTMDTLMS